MLWRTTKALVWNTRVPSLRSCVNDYVMMLVHSSCVGFKTFETSIPSRVNFAVPITFDGEHLSWNCLACRNWRRRSVATKPLDVSSCAIDRSILVPQSTWFSNTQEYSNGYQWQSSQTPEFRNIGIPENITVTPEFRNSGEYHSNRKTVKPS